MWITKGTDISLSRMDLEWYIPEYVWQSKGNHKNECTRFYDETKLLYIEADVSWVGLRADLQTRSNTSCPRYEVPEKCHTQTLCIPQQESDWGRKRYSNIEKEALGILYGLKIFHCYCFVRKVSIIMEQKPLVAIFKKNLATLSQRVHWILLNNTSIYSDIHIQGLDKTYS